MPLSRQYKDTLIIPTAKRLPGPADGPRVLARDHGARFWHPIGWAYVTRAKHAEWRWLEYTNNHKVRQRAWNKASKAK